MKEKIINFRSFLLKHVKNKQLRTLIWGVISYEMLSYALFGVGTVIVDYSVFSGITSLGVDALISNIISTLASIIFAYVTNKLWVFKSKTHGFVEVFQEFFRFANVRFATLLMTEIILLISKFLNGNEYKVKLFAMALTVIINYILSKLFIFKKERRSKNENTHKK